MTLTSEALPTWTPLEEHPGASTSVTLPKPPFPRSPAMSKLGVTPAISKSDHSKAVGRAAAGSSTHKKHSLSEALSADSSLFLPKTASPLGDCLCPEAAAQQAASLFSVESVQAVLAVGTSGPVFNARYSHNALLFDISLHSLVCCIACCARTEHVLHNMFKYNASVRQLLTLNTTFASSDSCMQLSLSSM